MCEQDTFGLKILRKHIMNEIVIFANMILQSNSQKLSVANLIITKPATCLQWS